MRIMRDIYPRSRYEKAMASAFSREKIQVLPQLHFVKPIFKMKKHF